MKFRKITLSGFAGFSTTVSLDLDASVVILLGSNGFGKSTVCDAIVWALTGTHPRLADPRSWYGSGETFVELVVDTGSEEADATIRRVISNPDEESLRKLKTSVIVRTIHGQLRSADAERWIHGWLHNSSADTQEELEDLGSALTDAFYLQQDSLRDFLANRSDDQRFAALSQMVGARALNDLAKDFESANRAWAKSVRKQAEEVDAQFAGLQSVRFEIDNTSRRLKQLEDLDSGGTEEWRSSTARLLGSRVDAHSPTQSVRELAEYLDVRLSASVSQLAEFDASIERLAQLERSLAPTTGFDASRADIRLSELEHLMRGLELARDEANRRVEAVQIDLRAAQTRHEELRALAELALRHISDTCPACGQDVNQTALFERLQAVTEGTPQDASSERMSLVEANQARDSILTALESTAAEMRELANTIETDRQIQVQRSRDEETRSQLRIEVEQIRSAVVKSGAAADTSTIEAARNGLVSWIRQANELRATYQAMAPALALASTQARIDRLLDEERQQGAAYLSASEALQSRKQTQAIADSFLTELKRDAQSFLNNRLREIQPILDQLYSAIDPHPTLRGMTLETKNWYGKNRLNPVLEDPSVDLRVDEPGRTLSTSQANALAVTLFLAFNLGLRPTRVATVILDDPLQNLDDVHLLGLVDLLRRLQPHRQILITTHDPTFASLLTRKMRPVTNDERLNLIQFDAWDREGPRVSQDHSEFDPQPMKLVAG